jgi:hypothetical protein
VNCITFTNWINAWSLRKGLRELGHELVTVDPGYLLEGAAAVPVQGDTLLFTEEASLVRYLGSDDFHFMPKRFPLDLLDDKFAFGEYAQSLGVAPIPQWASPESMPKECFPVVLKARRSWLNDDKMPRGWVCRSQEDIRFAQDEISRLRLLPDIFFIQKWLPAVAEDNFSVCGFWDALNPQRNLVCVVQRKIGYGADLTSSSVVGVVPDPDELVERCRKILDALKFQGPFELEFLRHKNHFFTLELNPRFWMQHGLFVRSENGLLKRYLGLDTQDDWGKGIPEQLIWIDGMWLLRMIATFRWKVLWPLFSITGRRHYIPVLCPGIKDAFSCLLAITVTKIKARVSALILRVTPMGRKT